MMLTFTIALILLNKQKYLNKTIHTYLFTNPYLLNSTTITTDVIKTVKTKGIYLELDIVKIPNEVFNKLKLDILKQWNLSPIKDKVAIQINNQIYKTTDNNSYPDFMFVINQTNSSFQNFEVIKSIKSETIKEQLLKNFNTYSFVSVNGYSGHIPEHKQQLLDFISDSKISVYFTIAV